MRPATGQVIERRRGHDTTFALRFRASGKRRYQTLGKRSEGWTRARAEDALADVLAQIRLGIWQPPEPPLEPEPEPEPHTFHSFASAWLDGRRHELSPRTVEDYTWSLSVHLLPWFANRRLDQITVEEVDKYRRAKVRESERRREAIAAGKPLRDRAGRILRPLGASSTNKTLKHLATVLDEAVEYDLIARNPAKGRRRRLKAPRSQRAHLDRAQWIAALLDAAGELDRQAKANRDRRAMLSVLMFAGLRIGEAVALRWRDVDLPAGRLRVPVSKTDAGVRYVPLLPVLHDELGAHRARAGDVRSGDLVFSTSAGTARDRNAVRTRMLHPAVERANERLEQAGCAPMPERLTLHGLRHTYVSLRLAVDNPPDLAAIARDAGHADVLVTARVYSHVMAIGDGERDRLRALVEGAPLGTTMGTNAVEAVRQEQTA